MKKFLLPLAAMAAVAAAAAPAAAQPWRDGGHGRYEHRNDYRDGRLTTSYVDGLEWKINNAAQYGRISWGEARELKREFREVQPLAWRVQTGAARPWEVQRLDRAVSHIEQAVGDDGRRGWRR
jgi:hypothetical protein